jgi:hypothetical protein
VAELQSKMAEALAIPLGISMVKGVGQTVAREGEPAVKAVIEFFRGFDFKQNIDRQQIIRDIISSVYGFFNNMIKYVILLILMLKQHHIYFFIYNVSYMINYELEFVSKLVN